MSEETCRVCAHPNVAAIDERLKDGRGIAAIVKWSQKQRTKHGAEWGTSVGAVALRAHRVDCLGMPKDVTRVSEPAAPPVDPLVAKLGDPEYIPTDDVLSAATRREMLRKIGDLSGKDLYQLRLQELKVEEARLREREKNASKNNPKPDSGLEELTDGVRAALGHVRHLRKVS